MPTIETVLRDKPAAFKAKERVKVVAPGESFDGWVGTIKRVAPAFKFVEVAFDEHGDFTVEDHRLIDQRREAEKDARKRKAS